VKNRNRIHIIPLEELYCIQACGDYVTLFTASEQYIKEQTMKYFEEHLPPASFVRIHRSVIVNTSHILRVELFGKETYQVRLKNGGVLKASSAGYRLLKERLSL
jgi:DNA-binding LytR/AlgR family response regulator